MKTKDGIEIYVGQILYDSWASRFLVEALYEDTDRIDCKCLEGYQQLCSCSPDYLYFNQPVVDVDSHIINIGDTVYELQDGSEWIVVDIVESNSKYYIEVKNSETSRLFLPEDITHYQHPDLHRLYLLDEKSPCDYNYIFYSSCLYCNSKEPMEQCEIAMRKDLISRAYRLDR